MRKISLITLLVLCFVSIFSVSAMAAESWYEITDGVLTLRLDTAKGSRWDFEISDPACLELITMEYVIEEGEEAKSVFAASFTNFSGNPGETTLSLTYVNFENMPVNTLTLTVAVDENGVTAVSPVVNYPAEEIQGYADLPSPLALVKNITSEGVEFILGYMDVSKGEEFAEFVPYNSEISFLPVAENTPFMLPGDLYEPMILSEIEDYNAWYHAACESLGFTYEFFAVIGSDASGITSLEYVYVP